MLGRHVQMYPDMVRRIYRSGNEIGSHSFAHKDFKAISLEEMYRELDETSRSIYETVGARPILVRPPYGNITEKIAGKIGRVCVLWTVDPEDWRIKNAAMQYNRVMDTVQDGDIVLLHDIYEHTAKATANIVRELTARGYKLVTVSQMMQIADKRGQEIGMVVHGLRAK